MRIPALMAICALCAAWAGAQDLPDRPGAVHVARPAVSSRDRAARALPPLHLDLPRAARSLPGQGRRDAALTIRHEPGSVVGRLDLRRRGTSETLTMFLHGQGEERIALETGDWRLEASFWIVGQGFPQPYPHSVDFSLRPGQTAGLVLTDDDLRAVKKWLKAQGE